MRKTICACLCLLCLCLISNAQSALPTPEQFLGYPLGNQFTTHDKILAYVKQLASQSPGKCKIAPYGSTYEGRQLMVAVIASETNLQRLEEIRTSNLKRTGLMDGQPMASQPAIAWMSYNIHGNESVSSEAVMQVLYDLLNPANEQTQKWLENTIVLLDPCVNPDGRERYVQWYKQTANQTPNPSPYAWEHAEPWPGGRPNHYLFDLNRDWAWLTQKETQQRIALYNQWMPQLHADFHEMGPNSPYYFSPAAKPYHADITPWQRQFQQFIGEYNRQYFDRNNWLYFTRENYDLFYPSYGDTYPTFNGAIGMTYEQGGSGRAGLALAREQGDTLTLKERIAHHHAASLATLEAIAARSKQAVDEFTRYFDQSRRNPIGTYKTYVVKAKNNPGTAKQLADYLTKHDVRCEYASKSASVNGFNYATGKTGSAKVEENDLLISAYQPKSTLLKVLFEPNPALEDSLTYDITSWALPYAYGLETYALKERLSGNAQPKNPAQSNLSIEKPYAYLARWQSLADARFLAELLKHKIAVRIAETAFETGGQTYQPGTLLITRSGNEAMGARFDQLVRARADSNGVTLAAVSTGFVTKGSDFGSANVHFVKAPKVAVLAGETIDENAFGEVWHFFEQQIGYPVTVIRTDYLSRVPLREFDVLILPNGSYGEVFPERALASLKDWIRSGGKLIALEDAAGFFAGKPDFALKKKQSGKPEVAKAQSGTPYDTLPQYGERERSYINEAVLGSVYRVSLDNSHPLAFGYSDIYYALLLDAAGYAFMSDGWNVGIIKKDSYLTGFAGQQAKEVQDTLLFGVQDLGRGQVVYLINNPLFRGFWQGGKLLFSNAVFLVGD